MDAGSVYVQDVRYFARGMDAGSVYVQDVRYFARGMDAGSVYVNTCRDIGISLNYEAVPTSV